MIVGYAEQSQGHAALTCFESMQEEGLIPDEITFICILKACGSTGSIEIGKCIHREIFRKGYVQEGQWNEALKCFESMQNDGLTLDEITFTCMLKACGNIGAINIGQKIHDEVVSRGLVETNIVIGTALADMYANTVFSPKQNICFLNFRYKICYPDLHLLQDMSDKDKLMKLFSALNICTGKVCPNVVTVLCILNACNHTRLIKEAETYFRDLSRGYSLEQHTCMVGAFGYGGHFDKAIAVIKKMPCSDHPQVWLAMLSACRKWGNVELGRLAFDQVLKLDIKSTVQYILMANIYAAAGMNEDAEKVEVMRIKPTRKSKP